MAEKNDREMEYTAALQGFAKSLEYLVKAMKAKYEEEAKERASGSAKDEAKTMAEVVEDLRAVRESTEKTKTNTEQILDIVKGIREERKKGIWEKLSGAKDKTKSVAEGIKTIALMAGAILAIGTAFKIVGEVDFASVLALTIALPLVAEVFNTVGETSKSPKESASIAFSMIIMAAGITASGAIMSIMPSLSLPQMVSVVAVAIAMGAAMYALANAADDIGRDRIGNIYAIAPAMPFVAGGILLSGMILSKMPIVGGDQFLSALGTGLAMGISMIPLALAADAIGGDVKDLLLMTVAMPLFAMAIYHSAAILTDVPNVDFLGTLEASLAVTASGVIMAGGIWLIDKLGLGLSTVIEGTIALTILSAGLMASSWILSIGNYDTYPSLDWAEGVGLSLLASLPVVLGFGLVAATGIGALVIGAGILSMMAVAAGIAATSHIIGAGNYSGGPTVEWATAVGMAIMAFTNTLAALSPSLFGIFFGNALEKNIESILLLGDALKQVSYVIKGGSYTGGPSKEWSEGVGWALALFANALDNISPNVFERLLFGDTVEQNIMSMIMLGGALHDIGVAVGSDTSVYKGGPSKRWADGVGGSLAAFAAALDNVEPGFWDTIMGKTLDTQIRGMIQIAAALPLIGKAVGSDTSMYKGGPSEKWAKGIGGTVTAFASAIATLADEIDTDDLADWLPALMLFAPIIGYYGKMMSGVKFDSSPSKSWTDNITHFIDAFSELEAVEDAEDTAYDMYVLARSYIMLAKGLDALSDSLSGLKEIPDMSSLYGGIVTLSLVDSDNLEDTLDVLYEKKKEFSKVLSMIKASSEVKIDENTFSFNKDTERRSVQGTATSPKAPAASPSAPVKATPKPAAPAKPDKQEELLRQMVSLMEQLLNTNNEIADNTSHKMSGSSIITN